MPEANIGVIGGTGLYEMEGLEDIEETSVDTPFGKPSDSIITGTLEGTGIAFLSRHGRGHVLSPTEIPSKANIYALKSLGVEHIIAVCSAGSFKKEIEPGHLLIPDQLIDRTKMRDSTFFGNGIVGHIAFADPFCPVLSDIVYESARETGVTVHKGGTLVVMEGPAFSTRAESRLYRSWGADLIGMTALPEAKLAREAEMCYTIIGCVTDYDSWWKSAEAITVDVILNILHHNVDTAKDIIRRSVTRIPERRDCPCSSALQTAFVTAPEKIPEDRKQNLELIIGRYL